MLNIKSVEEYKEISNSIGFLRGSLFPGKYILKTEKHNTSSVNKLYVHSTVCNIEQQCCYF